MHFRTILSSVSITLASFIGIVDATPLSSTASVHSKFSSKLQQDVGLRFVKNSGVCETTGASQISGYIDIGTNMSMVCGFAILLLRTLTRGLVVLVF